VTFLDVSGANQPEALLRNISGQAISEEIGGHRSTGWIGSDDKDIC
jgi:1,2-phenylacetyl-CoA epoxidase catalytic subunit